MLGTLASRFVRTGCFESGKVGRGGEWRESQILLGFGGNVNSLRIALPTPRIVYAEEVINRAVFTPGNRIIPVRKVQELRGIINHWDYADRFWKYWTDPINALLIYSDSAGTWIRSDNDQVWIALWNLVRILRSISGKGEMWKSLFMGSLSDVISMEKRLCCNNPPVTATWATGDAVLTRFASINWSRREYVVAESGEFFNEVHHAQRHIVISDSEQLSATCAIAVWGHAGQVLLPGTGNRNVLSLTPHGYSEKGDSLILNQATAKFYCKSQYHGSEILPA